MRRFSSAIIRLHTEKIQAFVRDCVWFECVGFNVNVYRSEYCTVAHLTIESTNLNIPHSTLIQLHLKVAECVVERHVDTDFVVNTIYDLHAHERRCAYKKVNNSITHAQAHWNSLSRRLHHSIWVFRTKWTFALT